MADEKRGITVKIDDALHAEVKQFIESQGMTMAEFVSQALYNELHPKTQQQEVKNMERMRTMAFNMPESMFQRLKEYLHRHRMTQKEFVLGLVEAELNRDQALMNKEETEMDNTINNDDEMYDESEEQVDGYEPDESFDEDQEDSEEFDDEDLDDEESENEDFGEDEDESEELDDDEELDDEESEDEDFGEDMDSDEAQEDSESIDNDDSGYDDEEADEEETESEEFAMAM